MPKLKLVAEPTFKAMVPFGVHGGEPVEVELTFRHRTKTGLDEFVKSRADKPDGEAFMEFVCGWELDDAFTRENVDLLLENRMGVGIAAYEVYMRELIQARLGNFVR